MKRGLNVFQRLGGKLLGLPVNKWEAAGWTEKRANLPNNPLPVKRDIQPTDRKTVMARCRLFEKNNPIMGALLEAFASYGVHTGINPLSASSSMAFNRAADDYWDEWVNYAFVDSRLNFYKGQELIDRRELVDGDIASILTYNDNGDARIQLMEGHQIRSATSPESENEFDGVLLDGRGRPVGYRFFADSDTVLDESKSRLISADDVVLHYSPIRVRQYRGIGKFANVLPALHDLHELLGAEMEVAKANTQDRDIIYNDTGEDEDDDATKSRYSLKDRSTGDEDETVEQAEARKQFYEQQFGPKTSYMLKGHKHEHVVINRPSPAWQGYVRLLLREICAGTGVSYDLVLDPSEQGGAPIRFVIEKDQRFFERRIMQRISEYRRIRNYVIGKAIDNGALYGAPRDWWKHDWKKPRRASVDLGRDAKSRVQLLAAGYDCPQEFYGEDGKDWRKQLRNKAEAMYEAGKLAKEFSRDGVELTKEEVMAMDPNVLSAKAKEGSGDADTGESGSEE